MTAIHSLNNYNKDFKTIKIIIEESIGNIAIYRAMNDVLRKDSNYILVHQLNNSALIVSIRFCNIFGSYSEENHWKNFFKELDVEEKIINDVILKVFNCLEEWKKYYESIKLFRDKYAVHHSNNAFSDKILLPDYEIAFRLLKKYYYFVLKELYGVAEEQVINGFDSMYKKVYADTFDLYKRLS